LQQYNFHTEPEANGTSVIKMHFISESCNYVVFNVFRGRDKAEKNGDVLIAFSLSNSLRFNFF
jgi:hypothetical protein